MVSLWFARLFLALALVSAGFALYDYIETKKRAVYDSTTTKHAPTVRESQTVRPSPPAPVRRIDSRTINEPPPMERRAWE